MGQKKFVLAVWVALMVCVGTQAFALNAMQEAITKAGLKMEDVRAVTTFYYQNPQPEKMVAVLKVLVTVDELTQDSAHFPMIAHIFATAAYSNKALKDQMIMLKDSLSGGATTILENIIKEADNLESPKADSVEHVNLLWAEFFATGKPEPVKKVIAALGTAVSGADNNKLVGIIQWSLSSNVKQHKIVYQIVKDESVHATGVLKDVLEKML
ncbi:MAG: hypothetical protein HQL15_09085 [Candidatus Omnitrophica bacterium]|nr:hypothetical protein [Candidatus Omnitrophota bacterium]